MRESQLNQTMLGWVIGLTNSFSEIQLTSPDLVCKAPSGVVTLSSKIETDKMHVFANEIPMTISFFEGQYFKWMSLLLL